MKKRNEKGRGGGCRKRRVNVAEKENGDPSKGTDYFFFFYIYTTMDAQPTMHKTVPSSSKRRPVQRKKKPVMTAKQQLIKDSAVHRQKIDKLVFVWQEKLFSQPKVPKPMLEKAVTYLQPRTFAEVIEERVVQNWCGYPLCDSEPQQLHKYKISLVQRKVFDQTELASYCSESCFMKSKYYSLQLSEEPVWFRDLNKQVEVHVITPDQDFE